MTPLVTRLHAGAGLGGTILHNPGTDNLDFFRCPKTQTGQRQSAGLNVGDFCYCPLRDKEPIRTSAGC